MEVFIASLNEADEVDDQEEINIHKINYELKYKNFTLIYVRCHKGIDSRSLIVNQIIFNMGAMKNWIWARPHCDRGSIMT